MGTRSLTRVYDEGGIELVCIYRQMDGYPGGHGQELADIASERPCNGYECLAATLVKELKGGVGGIYIYPTGSRDCGEEYEYHVKPDGGSKEPRIHVHAVRRERLRHLFTASPKDYKDLCTTYQALADKEA